MSRPPLFPPMMARRPWAACRSRTSHSAAAAKSSKAFCLRSSMPARCQSSPYSPPPRRWATAHRSLRDQLLPRLPPRGAGIGDEKTEARRAEIGVQVQAVVARPHAEQRVLPLHDGDEATFRDAVAQVYVGARPAPRDVDRQPAPVRGQAHPGPILGRAALTLGEDEHVAPPVRAQGVEENAPVIVLLAGRNRAGLRIADAVEARGVGQPLQRGRACPRDDVVVSTPVPHVLHAKDALLAPAFGEPVGEERAVRARVPPVERGGSVRAQPGGVEQNPVPGPHALADEIDGGGRRGGNPSRSRACGDGCCGGCPCS
jgi:hypothetical protein